MAYRLEVESVVARMLAAFPTYRMPKPTIELWIQKLSKSNDLDLRDAAERFIERGTRFPTIGEMLVKLHEIGSTRVKAKIDKERLLEAAPQSCMSDRERRALWSENFERGRRNQEEHLDRSLTSRDFVGCPCRDCTEREANRPKPRASVMEDAEAFV
jgi:hypothetical protein